MVEGKSEMIAVLNSKCTGLNLTCEGGSLEGAVPNSNRSALNFKVADSSLTNEKLKSMVGEFKVFIELNNSAAHHAGFI
jgi:hypothetical protein